MKINRILLDPRHRADIGLSKGQPLTRNDGGHGGILERFGHGGQGDGYCHELIRRQDGDDTDDLASRVRAHDAAVLADAGRSAATANSAGFGE
jgi:hypothetical protein